MLGCVRCQSVGSYSTYKASSGYAQALIFLGDASDAFSSITSNGSNMPAFTWSAFTNAMSGKGYPANEVKGLYDTAKAFGIIPKKWQDALSAKPVASTSPPPQQSAPPPSLPPSKTPGIPAPKAGWWESWGQRAAITAGILAGAFVVKRKFLKGGSK